MTEEDLDWKPSLDYHHLEAAGTCYYIDSETRREIEVWLKSTIRDQPNETIVFETILGETVTLTAGAVAGIYDSNPELRRRARLISQTLREERRSQGFMDDE